MIDTTKTGLVLPSKSSVDFGQRRIEKGRNHHFLRGEWTTADFGKFSIPRFYFLTASYVEWLGLKLVPIKTPRNQGIASYGDHGTLPPPGESPFISGVEFEGYLYKREWDGLSYVLI